MNKLTANGGKGFDHVCTKSEDHAVWDPQTNKSGKPCPILWLGKPCGGRLKLVGAGSRKLTAAGA